LPSRPKSFQLIEIFFKFSYFAEKLVLSFADPAARPERPVP